MSLHNKRIIRLDAKNLSLTLRFACHLNVKWLFFYPPSRAAMGLSP
ncbi:Uncharacterised protein [Vibrio cholerae]|nr:Uncharacterised protein [Vibrio cholerae]